MATLLVRNADVLVTMDDHRREVPNGALLVEDGIMTNVGKTEDLPQTAVHVIDARGQIVLPGLINFHH
ncbi:MAG: 8-oxoguanine deaminase, partial [Chloroflexota bacterium]